MVFAMKKQIGKIRLLQAHILYHKFI